jgi:hypothetical protein
LPFAGALRAGAFAGFLVGFRFAIFRSHSSRLRSRRARRDR